MSNRIACTCVWFTMVALAQNATLTAVQAEFTFFTDRVAWEAEANKRGLPFAEEDFDGFPDGPLSEIPSFTVGDIQFNLGDGVVQDGKLVRAIGSAVRFGFLPFFGEGSVEGPIGGIGMDLDVADSTNERGLNLFLAFSPDCPIPDPIGGPFPSCAVVTESHSDDGFIGVLFGSPREAEGFVFFGGPQFLVGADNLVVASIPIPEPSTLRLAAVAFLSLGVFRRKGTWCPSDQQN